MHHDIHAYKHNTQLIAYILIYCVYCMYGCRIYYYI